MTKRTDGRAKNLYHPLYGEPLKVGGGTVEVGNVVFRAYEDKRAVRVTSGPFQSHRPAPVLISDDHRIEVRYAMSWDRYWTIVDKERIYALTSPDYESQFEAMQAGIAARDIFDSPAPAKRRPSDDLRSGPSFTAGTAILEQSINEDQIMSMINAMQSAARRWNEWADDLALPEVAESFRKQAQEVEDIAGGLTGAVGLLVLRCDLHLAVLILSRIRRRHISMNHYIVTFSPEGGKGTVDEMRVIDAFSSTGDLARAGEFMQEAMKRDEQGRYTNCGAGTFRVHQGGLDVPHRRRTGALISFAGRSAS